MPSFSFNSFSAMGAHDTAPASTVRSSSVTSTSSLPALSHGRNGSVASTASSTSGGHGLKHFFSAEGKAERKEKKRQEQERINSVIITSRHAATVKTRLLMEQNNRRNSAPVANVIGTTQSMHLTAAAQEARLPHSGPPALHVARSNSDRDMPSLTRIVSCDEQDDEEESAKQHRDDWLRKKADVGMQRLREGSDAIEEDDVVEVINGQVVEVLSNDSAFSGSSYDAKPTKERRGYGAWSKNDTGVWTR